MTIIYIKTIAAALLGLLAGLAAVYFFNRVPAKWLCDYDEEPSEELKDPRIQRVKGWPWRWVYAGLLACVALRLIFTEITESNPAYEGLREDWIQLISQGQLMLAGLFACWALLIIGLADLKYMIIPDQFVILLAVAALGFLPLHQNWWQPLGGLLLGGGTMLLISVLGRVAFKRDVMGFGDVKLCAAMGLGIGIRGMLFVLVAGGLASGFAAALGLAAGRLKRDEMKPLGPWLCGAGIVYIFILLPLTL